MKLWYKSMFSAVNYRVFTCIVPETTPVQKSPVLVVVILQGHFVLLLEAGKVCVKHKTNKCEIMPSAEWNYSRTNSKYLCLQAARYLLRSDVWVNDVVKVFVNSIQQPEEEFLGIMLGVSFKLNGALRHHVLQGQWKTGPAAVRRHPSTSEPWITAHPHEIFSTFNSDADDQQTPKGQKRCKWWWGAGLEKLSKTRENAV